MTAVRIEVKDVEDVVVAHVHNQSMVLTKKQAYHLGLMLINNHGGDIP